MSTAGEDDELTFEEIEEPKAETPKAENGPEAELAASPEADAPAATAPTATTPNEANTKDQAEEGKPVEAAAARKRPPLAGIFLAVVLVLCLFTSGFAAWKASSAASALSHQAETEQKPRALDARLASIEKLLEQQRDTLDQISAKPTQVGGSDNAQITALATAVRANQTMSERIPSLVASAVQARVAAARPAVAPKPAAASAAKAVAKARAVKSAARFQQVAARTVTPPPPPPPPGDAIRYP